MEMNFCRRCGSALKSDGEGFRCQNGHLLFSNPAPTSGLFLLMPDKQTVVMSRRGIEPRKGELDCFGGFVDSGETFEESIYRELQEEAGLSKDDYSPISYLCSATSGYPYGGEDLIVLGVNYFAILKPEAQPKANDDVAEIVNMNIEDIDPNSITADDVRAGLLALREYLKNGGNR